MKTALQVAFALLAATALSAPGIYRPNLKLAWDPTSQADRERERVERFTIYCATNLPVGPGWAWDWRSTNQYPNLLPAAQWAPVWTATVVPPLDLTNATVLTAVLPGWPDYPGPYFFTLTVSNWVGESPFSNAVWTPRQPRAINRGLQILLTD